MLKLSIPFYIENINKTHVMFILLQIDNSVFLYAHKIVIYDQVRIFDFKKLCLHGLLLLRILTEVIFIIISFRLLQ